MAGKYCQVAMYERVGPIDHEDSPNERYGHNVQETIRTIESQEQALLISYYDYEKELLSKKEAISQISDKQMGKVIHLGEQPSMRYTTVTMEPLPSSDGEVNYTRNRFTDE